MAIQASLSCGRALRVLIELVPQGLNVLPGIRIGKLN